MDVGESLVGAYLRHVAECDVVTYNTYFADRQGEVDVVGIKNGSPRTVWLCEVTTHIGGMQIVRKGKNATSEVILSKLDRLHAFANTTFPDEHHHFQWWSPRVAVGALTAAMTAIENDWVGLGRELRFIINEEYTDCIRELMAHAATNSSTTNEPAYRLLQVLTRLRGGPLGI